jgi:hypothetical protein
MWMGLDVIRLGEDEPPGTGRWGGGPTLEVLMNAHYRYYAKEDPWEDDDDCRHGRPVILARMDGAPEGEAIWNGYRGRWEPFPDLWLRLIGGDWWDRIEEDRARRYFEADAFAGGPILGPTPEC